MKIIIIAAVSIDGVIGIGDNIPWRIPEDFKHFREVTMGNMLLVGATTFQTLPPKAHEGREFIILNSGEQMNLIGEQYRQFNDFKLVLDLLNNDKNDFDKVYVIGGASIYNLMIDYCDEAIITWVDQTYPEGDKRFPIVKLITNFTVVDKTDWMKSKNGYKFKYINYKRKS
jgi:dihydrofolate reductase